MEIDSRKGCREEERLRRRKGKNENGEGEIRSKKDEDDNEIELSYENRGCSCFPDSVQARNALAPMRPPYCSALQMQQTLRMPLGDVV